MSQIDKRIKVNTVIESHLPEFILADFPNAIEFFKQYYISQEFQGGPVDLISNFDQYIKPDNLVPEVVVGETTLSSTINSEDTTISVSSTKGFPSEYGLLKINDEIITYTGITPTSFTGCIRGFSGISGHNVGISSSLLEINRESLIFEDTTASSHTSGDKIINLSVLFLQEFYKKLKKTFLPGLEDNDFSSDLDVGNFVKFARSFYQSKGIEESIRILFKILYGVESTVLDLEGNLIKPSGAEFIRREVIVADLITPTGQPQHLVGQTIFKSTDTSTNASVSEVEILNRGGKNYYKISLFVGFSDRDLIEGVFTIPGKTKALSVAPPSASVISVDSTVGFGTTGTIISGQNRIDYTSKTLNQFFGCTGIGLRIETADDIRSDETIFGYENGDLTKRIDLRITGVLSELVPVNDVRLVREGESIFVKNVGEKIKNKGETYKQIFANSWKYNTSSRFEVGINGSTFSFNTIIDKSNLKVGDNFDILKRGEQVIVGSGQVSSIDTNLNQITASNIAGFTQDPNESYDIRRKYETASSTGVEIKQGNDVLISDVLNVYTDGDADGYVASNSLPNYIIDTDVIEETAVGSNLDGRDFVSGLYSYIQFTPPANTNIKFIQGDTVIYSPDSEVLSGLESGRTYYVDPIIPPANQSISQIALYESANQIGTASTVQIGLGTAGGHNFILQRHANRKLETDKILRRIPLSQNLFVTSKQEQPLNDIGILIDGVQIRSPISDNKIYFGPLESVDVINSGKNYDVVNPPQVIVENSTPAAPGTTAVVEPVLSGSVSEVIVDPQDFDIESVTSVSLTGGNGSGCVLQPVIGIRNRFLDFDSRNVFFNGGIDIVDETITFKKQHNLENGQLIYYSSNGNSPIGIGSAYDLSNTITGSLSDGAPYYVRVVNTSTVRIFNTKSDALAGSAGINTVGLSTDSAASGIHRFRTENKTTLSAIKVIESGSGYTNRKLKVKSSGISTSYDTINFVNHGFSSGEIIEYSASTPIQGLSTSTSYIISKVDDNSFKLADAGIAGTSTSDYERGKFVDLQSTGSDDHVFKYPDIKVNIEVSYGSTVTGTFNITPIVLGGITDVYLCEEGTNYGSSILNHQVVPEIKVQNGRNGELKPIIVNGKVDSVAVVNKGSEYFSAPEVVITDTSGGSGAVVRPIIQDGKIQDAVVVQSGIGYSSLTVDANVLPRGMNAAFSARVRSLTLNDAGRFGNNYLTTRENSLSFGILGYSQTLAGSLENSFDVKQNGEFDKITSHSPIIGWAYDGNPIYGPFGYSDPTNINSDLKIISSSYKLDVSNLKNRPSGFKEGFFIEDYSFDSDGDLDIHNGRFAKTPEFPNGIYAYFTSVGLSTESNKIEGKYPYFIGRTYRSPLINDNLVLTQDFDFNNSNLLRNTLPYAVDEEYADNDFIIESNETIRQLSKIESVTKGGVDNLQILDGGSGYKVKDLIVFDDEGTNGAGFSAEVNEIVGLGVSSINTTLHRFENLVFEWKSENEVEACYLPFMELNDKDYVSVTGLSTAIVNLEGSFSVGVSTDTIGLAKTMLGGNVAGKIEDIFVSSIPNTVSVGGTLRIDNETLRVLNLYHTPKVIRVERFAGAGHTLGSRVDVLNNRISIPAKTRKFNSKKNEIIYFNGPQSVGVGTTPGSAITVESVIGEIKENVSIPTRTIRIPNHPFKTGQKVKLNKRLGANRFDVGNTPQVSEFKVPYSGDDSIDVFIIDKGEDFIGILTSRVGIGSTSDGLYFYSKGSLSGINSGSYYFQTDYEQVTGDVDRVTSTVITNVSAADTTTHNLLENDIVKINVIPNLSVGIGTTSPISVAYNSEFEKLLINPITFAAADVETNRFDIDGHGLKTGDKIFYDGGITGLSTGSYFVNKISDRYFQLAETLSDLSSTPINTVNITANTGGSNQTIALINPRINVVKNSKLTFSLKDTSLANFDFKLFYDKDLLNEYDSSQDSVNFNVLGIGTIGIGTNNTDPIGGRLSVEFSKSTPEKLYYGVSKGGFISTSDTEVQNYAEIRFVDSIYNGEYKISNVTSETFDFSPKVPELLSYSSSDCETLEYSTKSNNVVGAIKDFKILSSGFNYKKLPKFKSVISENGTNANIVAISTSIGRIKDVRIVDIGYEYSSDKTLSPEAFIPPVLNIDNLDIIETVDIISGGTNYINAPNLIVFNPTSGAVMDNSSIVAITPNQTISEVKVLAPVTGLDSVNHEIIAINNSNGVGIGSIVTSKSGVVTCFLETPMNGFVDPQPFAIGDKIFVEGIQRIGETGVGATQGGISTETSVSGDGFNSENYNYQFFTVSDYIAGTQAILEFNLSGLTTNTGIAKTFQSGYATIVNKNNYPILRPNLTRGIFELSEKLVVNGQETDLRITEIRDDYVKIDGKFEVKAGDRIIGKSSNVSAEITSILENRAKFTTNFSNRQEYGWLDDIGKLNQDYQVIPNNDYYQNLSYTVKSSVEWDKFVNPVNRLVHPAGLRNFSDTSIESKVTVGVGTTALTKDLIVLDVNNVLGLEDKQRVDAINNFDFSRDFDTRTNSSKFVELSNKTLTDFTRCKTNRVLLHDDISNKFSSTGFQENKTIIEELTEDYANYIIQIVDPDTFDVQVSELVVLTTTDNAYLLEKTTDFTTMKLGDFSTEISIDDVKTLVFTPTEKFEKDHDIKILKIDFNTDLPSSGGAPIGNIDLRSVNVGATTALSGISTTSIVEFPKTDFNGLYANIFVEDSKTKEINYNEVIVDFDGTDTTVAQTYIDTLPGLSNSVVGVITARFENDLIKLQIENDRLDILNVRANIVGLGTVTDGIGTYRFSVTGQPSGSERSVRLESNYVSGTSNPLIYGKINRTIDSSVKSLVRVSCGETSAIHQVISLRDEDDTVTVQYPFVSAGSTTGIGTFGGEISGTDINLKFYPDAEFDSLIEVQAYNQIFYTANDFANTPPDLIYGPVNQKVFLSTYDGLSGLRANKKEFDLTHDGTPIYSKTFNPIGINSLADGVGLIKSTGVFNIPNHFFNTNEQLVYTPQSTFIGIAATPVSIGATTNSAGIVTTILPSDVFAKVIDENRFELFTRPEYITTGAAVTFTGSGSGNAHKLSMTKQLSKTIIGLDGVVQQPITFTTITHTLGVFDGFTYNNTVGIGLTQLILSGISSITTSDILKIDDEFMTITEVGFSSTPTGTINDAVDVSLGIATLPCVKVRRGELGAAETVHVGGSTIRVHRGSFNIVDSKIFFTDPPKGNTRSRRDETNLPFVKADYSGRTFLRSNYTTNMLFDDISDSFTGIGKTYNLTVGGANTASGIGVGNGILFINGVFQTPLTQNNVGNNYEFISDTTAGISTVEFTGITSTNGEFIVSDSDINQNQVPRGGIIVSLGSTAGLGYAPLVGAKVKAFKDSNGGLTSIVGIGTSSGFNLGIQTAVYDNASGIITVTTNEVHGFGLERPNTVKLKGLEFACPKTVVGQPTFATYNPTNGRLVITIANHGLVENDAVILDIGSICFRCDKDSFATVHCYPRATDPAAGQYLTVSNVTQNTFQVNVGASDPADNYVHQFESATATAVKTIGGGGYVGVTTTIFQDHERPLFVVGIVSDRSFEVQAGPSTIPHNYQGGGVAYEFFEDLTFGSGYRGGSVNIEVIDQAYEHKFVSAGINSIRKGNFAATGVNAFTATDAVYTSNTGTLVLTIPNHGLSTSDTVGIDTGGLLFKCSKDNFFSNHPYPRSVSKTSFPNSDPIAGIQTAIIATTTDSITLFVGQGGGGGTGAEVTATVGVGGTLSFNIVSAGTSYVNPEIIIPEPNYDNLPVVGVSRFGIGPTTDTGSNLLIDVQVSAAKTSVGIGSTTFEISNFQIARQGHSFKVGDKFKPVGLVTAAHLSQPINEFELEVTGIFNDQFSAWQFGELDFIDDIRNLQDGVKTRFPLFFNGQLLSFEKDLSNSQSALINLDAVLLIFVNGVLQKPGESYQFQGGTTFTFLEAPSGESSPGANDHDKVDIFFYKGQEGIDVDLVDVQESVKRGDEIRLMKSPVGVSTAQESERVITDLLGADLIETNIYTGLGVDEIIEKPVRWTKQKVDVVVNGEIIDKSRPSLEPQIYPTAKIIGDLTDTSGSNSGDNIFVDNVDSFFYEEGSHIEPNIHVEDLSDLKYNININEIDALITSGHVNVGAAATAVVSATGTISNIDITENGRGYSITPRVSITPPVGAGLTVGTAATAFATATLSNGTVDNINLTGVGAGYTRSNPPQVLIEEPSFQTEKITSIDNIQGFTGIITGIKEVTNSGQLGIKFFFRAERAGENTNDLEVGYPIMITDTTVGTGITSVDTHNDSIVGIGTNFLDNIYIVHDRVATGSENGEITCNILNGTTTGIGVGLTGKHSVTNTGNTISLGRLSWGRLYNATRSDNPISIGVTGLTVNSGLTTFPTIQRKNYAQASLRGLRSTGAIRVFGL